MPTPLKKVSSPEGDSNSPFPSVIVNPKNGDSELTFGLRLFGVEDGAPVQVGNLSGRESTQFKALQLSSDGYHMNLDQRLPRDLGEQAGMGLLHGIGSGLVVGGILFFGYVGLRKFFSIGGLICTGVSGLAAYSIGALPIALARTSADTWLPPLALIIDVGVTAGIGFFALWCAGRLFGRRSVNG